MADLNLNFDTDNKQINLGSDTVTDTGINLSNIASPNNDDLMLGVELLANQEKSVEKPNTPSPKPVIQETIPKNENLILLNKHNLFISSLVITPCALPCEPVLNF